MSSPEPGPPGGQWSHLDLFRVSLPATSQLTLGEGHTPLEAALGLGEELGIPHLYLKREDRNPTGSHKARCLSLLCSELVARGGRQAVISSSGNAAVAATAYASLGGIHLLTLISPATPKVKVARLLGHGQLVAVSSGPVALLHHAVEAWGLSDLRQSTNRLAPNAYRGIAAELLAGAPPAAVFLYSSSGACALGIWQGLERLLPRGDRPELHVVEAEPGGELTRPWSEPASPEPPPGPLVGALGTKRSRLAPAVRRAVRASGGRGWRVGRGDLERVRELAARHQVFTSWEGLATLAAMHRAATVGAVDRGGRWVAVLTGDETQLDLEPLDQGAKQLPAAESTAELDRLLEGSGFRRGGP